MAFAVVPDKSVVEVNAVIPTIAVTAFVVALVVALVGLRALWLILPGATVARIICASVEERDTLCTLAMAVALLATNVNHRGRYWCRGSMMSQSARTKDCGPPDQNVMNLQIVK